MPPEAALKALTSDAARILGAEEQLGTLAPGKAAHVVLMDGDFQEAKTRVHTVFADGVRFDFETQPPGSPKPAEVKKGSDEPKPAEAKDNPDERKDAVKPAEVKPAASAPEEQTTELEADRKPKVHTGGNVLIRNATVLTVTNGTLPKTDILALDGKIAGIGPGLTAPEGTTVLDADGMFVMPGIIDTHCHFAIAGGVNETSLSVVPEVRVRNVIDSENVQIYRASRAGSPRPGCCTAAPTSLAGRTRSSSSNTANLPAGCPSTMPRGASSSPWVKTSSAPTAGFPTPAWEWRRCSSALSARPRPITALGKIMPRAGPPGRPCRNHAGTYGWKLWPTSSRAT